MEHAASGRAGARALRHEVPEGRTRRAGGRVRLREGAAGFDRQVAAAPAERARHRRVRPQREPREPARILRSRLPVRDSRHARRAGARRQDRCGGRAAGAEDPQHQPGETESGDFVTTEGTPRATDPSVPSVMETLVSTDFNLPELGENITAGDVLRVLVQPGDVLAKDQPVLELETDKATIEVPSSVAGQVKEIKVKAGDKVKVGQAILSVDDNGSSAAAPKTAAAAKPAAEARPAAESKPAAQAAPPPPPPAPPQPAPEAPRA